VGGDRSHALVLGINIHARVRRHRRDAVTFPPPRFRQKLSTVITVPVASTQVVVIILLTGGLINPTIYRLRVRRLFRSIVASFVRHVRSRGTHRRISILRSVRLGCPRGNETVAGRECLTDNEDAENSYSPGRT